MVKSVLKPEPLPFREYPCPECGYKVPQEHIHIVEVRDVLDVKYMKDPKYEDHVKGTIALSMGDFMYKNKLITFEKREEQLPEMVVPLIGKVGVLTKRQTKTFEQRVFERQMEVAQEVARVAIISIRHFGSLYDGGKGSIQKDVATGFIAEALHKVERGSHGHI